MNLTTSGSGTLNISERKDSFVWFHAGIDENDLNFQENLKQLQTIHHIVHTFNDIDQCIDFLTDLSRDTVSLIIPDTSNRQLIILINEIPQLHAVFILYKKITSHMNYGITPGRKSKNHGYQFYPPDGFLHSQQFCKHQSNEILTVYRGQMCSVFRIHDVQQFETNEHPNQIHLLLTNDNSESHRRLNDSIRQKIKGLTPQHSLDLLLWKIHAPDTREEIQSEEQEGSAVPDPIEPVKYSFENHEDAKQLSVIQQTRYCILYDKENYLEALRFFEKALAIKEQHLFGRDHPNLVLNYDFIGTIYELRMGDYKTARFYYKRVLNLVHRHSLPLSDSDIQRCKNHLRQIKNK
ncbi:unnamed protein product [Adineta ricciae]|uniref:Tetratricopeptide repeat protein n=1 Tax=Adineta ricciae TaxID=249248 RepID=A0A814JYU6_ADIRI|nr:unnamed protein product [Adineta ricciae]CAF1355095.1 unnamed protein product [Adineta ricciae]